MPTLEETGYQRRAVARAGTACSRRPARRGRSSTGWPRKSPRIVSNPDFAEKHLKARSLVGATDTPDEFAKLIAEDRKVAEQVVKDAGMEPQ